MSLLHEPDFGVVIDTVPGQVTIRPRGELDLASLPAFTDAVREAEETGVPCVVVDLRELAFIDSSGVTELLRATDRGRTNGHRLEFLRAAGPVETTLRVMGVAELLPRAA